MWRSHLSQLPPKAHTLSDLPGPIGVHLQLGYGQSGQFSTFACTYSSSGCEITLPHTEKADHEELCEFRPCSCPFPGVACKWQGSLGAVVPHLTHHHESMTTLQGEDIVFLAIDINLPGAVDWMMVQSCFDFDFMLVLEKQENQDGHQQFFAIVQLIGTREQAKNSAY